MTLRVVNPANGANQLVVNWDNGSTVVIKGQVLDVVPGSAHETAIGVSNLVTLSGTALANDQGGMDQTATGNG